MVGGLRMGLDRRGSGSIEWRPNRFDGFSSQTTQVGTLGEPGSTHGG